MNSSSPPVLPRLLSAIETVWGPSLRELEGQLSRIAVSSSCRKFVVNRMGSTGSTWLAKLLNSHADVFCYHEEVVARVFPAQDYGSTEILRFLESLATETGHGAYRAIGDVGSVWTGHAAYLPAFTTAILIRHPARLLKSRLHILVKSKSFTEIPEQSTQILRLAWDIEISDYGPIDQIFLQDLLTFAAQIWALAKIDLLIRVEDLKSVGYCQRALRLLTGVRFPRRLIQSARRRRVNQRTGEPTQIRDIVAGFSIRQRDWYEQFGVEAARLFGYDPWSDDIDAPRLPADARAQDRIAHGSVQEQVSATSRISQ